MLKKNRVMKEQSKITLIKKQIVTTTRLNKISLIRRYKYD